MNPQTFQNGLAGLGEYFDKTITKAVANIYWRKLKSLSDEQFNTAVDQCIDDCRFFPKVSEIKSRVPESLRIENKGSLSWCDNTQRLMDKYGEQP